MRLQATPPRKLAKINAQSCSPAPPGGESRTESCTESAPTPVAPALLTVLEPRGDAGASWEDAGLESGSLGFAFPLSLFRVS